MLIGSQFGGQHEQIDAGTAVLHVTSLLSVEEIVARATPQFVTATATE